MIELGKTQCLNVVKIVDFGIYLGTEEDKVLLPKKQVPQDIEVGDALTVFVYRDSSPQSKNAPILPTSETFNFAICPSSSFGVFVVAIRRSLESR